MIDAQARALCATTAAWLCATSVAGTWAFGQSAVAVSCLVWLWAPMSTATSTALAVVVLLGIAERWYALRLRLDAGLFRAMACGDIASLATLDGALFSLGLRTSAGENRTLQSRIDGTQGLVRCHAGLVLAQAGCLLAAWSSHSI